MPFYAVVEEEEEEEEEKRHWIPASAGMTKAKRIGFPPCLCEVRGNDKGKKNWIPAVPLRGARE